MHRLLLFAVLGAASLGCSGQTRNERGFPDGFLVSDDDSGAARDLGVSTAADLAGSDLAVAPGADLAPRPGSDLAGVDQAKPSDLAAARADGSQSGVTPDKCADAVELVSGVELLNQNTTGLANDATFGNTVADPAACVEVTGSAYAAADASSKITVPT